jgi:hypothetical protein
MKLKNLKLKIIKTLNLTIKNTKEFNKNYYKNYTPKKVLKNIDLSR